MSDPTNDGLEPDAASEATEFVSQDPPSTTDAAAAPTEDAAAEDAATEDAATEDAAAEDAATEDAATEDAAGDPASDGDDPLATEISDVIAELAAERDQFKDIAQRRQADFENFRKAVAARQAAEIERATGLLAEALLPVLDAAEAAYLGHPDEVGPLLNLLLTELKKQGLQSIDLLDQRFDPNLADAVAHEAGDGGEVVVAEVLRSGYTWNGRTLRPAMVRTRD